MPIVEAIHIAPVKSLAVLSVDSARVDAHGIVEDRRFIVQNDAGRAVTQRQIGTLALVRAEYDADANTLRLVFPDGVSVSGSPEAGQRTQTRLFGRIVSARVVDGDWAEALSDFCGQPLTLAKSDAPGMYFDEHSVSLLSQASIDRLNSAAQHSKTLEVRRFRPTLLLGGCDSYEEDTWLDKQVSVGERLRLRPVKLDPRCVITRLDPDTGAPDFDTLRLLLGSRPRLQGMGAYFGVYGTVDEPGTVAVGDAVEVAA